MKKQLIIFLNLLILGISCKQKTKEIQVSEINTSSVSNIKETEDNYIINDSLKKELFNDLIKITRNAKFQILKKPVTNKHNPSITDTIKTLTFGKNKIESYLAKDREIVCNAEITNSYFIFLDSIKIGITKQKFQELIKTKIQSNIISIGELERTSVFNFFFKKGKLNAITYEGYLD